MLVAIDMWAAKKDGLEKMVISEDEKFKFSDLRQFNGLPFWLVTLSCVIIYMVIFPYVQYSSDMLEDRFGFGKSAGTFYALPYIISGVMSPILGIIIDKIGKRALFSKCPFFHICSASVNFCANCEIFLYSHVLVSVHPTRLHNHNVDLTI